MSRRVLPPSEPIDRKTVAVWVVRVLDGQDPPRGLSRFDDVDCCLPVFWSSFIERMAELGVTRGCGDGSGFCPNRNMTRAEMAAFLSRAFNLPDGPDAGFSDVPDDAWYAADVARLKVSGITVGCGDGTIFCPSRITTRAEMATFLKRAIDYGSIEEFAINDEADLVPAYALASQKPSSVERVDIWVHYCGPSSGDNYTISTVYDSSRLRDAVAHLQHNVEGFYHRESGYQREDDGPIQGSRIVFHEGKILSPQNVSWDQQTVSTWFDRIRSGIADPCRIAAVNENVDLGTALFLVPVPMSKANINVGTAGYAPPGGPALVATVEIHGDTNSYLHTVAHEIGHAYYYWDHPWQDEEPPLKYSDNPADQDKIRAQVSEHRLRSIMSYPIFEAQNDFSSDATENERAYVACYQRTEWKWVDENCELPNPRPGQINAPRLTPGDGLLAVSWEAPTNNSDRIVRYDVRYRRADGGTWQDWKPADTHRTRETSITGLTNDIAYEVIVRAATQHRTGFWSGPATMKPMRGQTPTVTLKVGDSASDDGACIGASCRWLHIEIEGFGPGPHTLACAHEGVETVLKGRLPLSAGCL